MVEKPFKVVRAVLSLEQETVLLYPTTLYQNKQTQTPPLSCCLLGQQRTPLVQLFSLIYH